jgi:hypothetical protein
VLVRRPRRRRSGFKSSAAVRSSLAVAVLPAAAMIAPAWYWSSASSVPNASAGSIAAAAALTRPLRNSAQAYQPCDGPGRWRRSTARRR